MDTERPAAESHQSVKARSVEGVAECQGVLGIGEVYESIADIATFVEVEWQIQEVNEAAETMLTNLLQEHPLSVLPWDLTNHNRHHTSLP